MDEQKASMLIVAMVTVVAAVGILVLISGSQSFSLSSDISGQATTTAKYCTDSDEDDSGNGMRSKIYGTATVTQGGTTIDSKEDSCTSDKTAVNEAYCGGDSSAKSKEVACSSGYICDEGMCKIEIVESQLSVPETSLLFKLKDFTNEKMGSDNHLTELYEESSGKKAKDISKVHLQKSSRSSGTYHFDFAKATNGYILFADLAEPSEWVVVQADVKVSSGAENDHAVLVEKGSSECGQPLYSLYTENGQFHFTVTLNYDAVYDVHAKQTGSSSPSSSEWRTVIGVFTGDEVQIYVDDMLIDSEKVSATLVADNGAGNKVDLSSLGFGYSKDCSDYEFDGYLDNIYIYGE